MTQAQTLETGLARVLREQGRRQNWLADQLGISRQRLHTYVTGKVECPDYLKVQISKLLGVSIRRLFFDHLEG